MSNTSEYSNSKRIASNTIVLYIRMVVVLLISLYTSRIVLKSLGIEDFGLFNVVAGVVGLFSFFRSAMERSTLRFINAELVTERGQVNRVFCASVSIHIILVCIVLLLSETIGLWFVNNYIQIPIGRSNATKWIYQCSILSLCLTVIQVPYSAFIIAHEKMGIFAVIGICDAILKLFVAFLLCTDNVGDKLIMYGTLLTAISTLNFIAFFCFCRFKYKETKFVFVFEKKLYKQIASYLSWTVLGNIAIVFTNQGNSILINMFYGVTANAAMAVGSQVHNAVVQLSSNFQTAFNPQITKSFVEHDFHYLKSLVYSTTKISFTLLFVVVVPLIVNMEFVLDVWLDDVPKDANVFCILFLISGLFNAISSPTHYCVLSSSNIRCFQIVSSIIFLSDLLIVYILFSFGFPAYIAIGVHTMIMAVILFVRIYFAHKLVPTINILSYFKEVLLPILFAAIISILLSLGIKFFAKGFVLTCLCAIGMFMVSFIAIYYIALSPNERSKVLSFVKIRA